MIKVNLLPPEYRKVERTPILRFVTILAGVVLSASAIGSFLYVHFGMLVEKVSEREKREETYVTKRVIADRSVALAKEAEEYKNRRNTIEDIGKKRMLWSRKLDELADIINDQGSRKRHLVWLTTARTLARTKGSPGGLYMKGFSGGSEIARLSDFHLDTKNSPFFEDFKSIDNPEGKVVRFKDERVPKDAWEFDFNLRLKPFGERNKGK